MPATPAERQRQRRERQREGKVVLHIVVDAVDVAEAMIALKHLHPANEDDRAALEAAIERFLSRIASQA